MLANSVMDAPANVALTRRFTVLLPLSHTIGIYPIAPGYRCHRRGLTIAAPVES